MKLTYYLPILMIFFALLMVLPAEAQFYSTTFNANVANPRGLNTEGDAPGVGSWTVVVAGPQSSNIWSAAQAIPFPFEFFGTPVTHYKISQNGLVTFDTTVTDPPPNANTNLPHPSLPNMTIAGMWDNFTAAPPTGSGDDVRINIFGTAPGRQLWIKWYSFEYGSPQVSFSYWAIVLEETTNSIFVVDQYSSTTPLLTTTVGLQLNATTAVQYGDSLIAQAGNSSGNADNDYWEFFIPLSDDIGATYIATTPAIPYAGTAATIEVGITNFGLNTASGFNIGYMVDDGSSSSQAYVGTLNAGESDTVEFSTQWTPAAGGIFQLTGYTAYGSDLNTSNDSTSISVNVSEVFNATYTQDFELYTSGNPSTIGWYGADNADFGTFVPNPTVDGAWYTDGFGNVGTTGSARFNFYSTSVDDKDWIISPPVNMTAGGANPILAYDIAVTPYTGSTPDFIPPGDTLFVVYSTDGTNWPRSNILAQYTNADTIPPTGMRATISISALATEPHLWIGFLAMDPPNAEDINLYIDNVMIGEIQFDIAAELITQPKLTMTPLTQTGLLSSIPLEGLFSNSGPTNSGDLNMVITDEVGTVVHSDVLSGVTINGGSDSTFTFAPANAAGADSGRYDITMYASNFMGANLSNDTMMVSHVLGDQMAFDNGVQSTSATFSATARSWFAVRYTLSDPDTLRNVKILVSASALPTDSFAVELWDVVNDSPNVALATIYSGAYSELGTLPALVTFELSTGYGLAAGDFAIVFDMKNTNSYPCGIDFTALGADNIPNTFWGKLETTTWLPFETVGAGTWTPIIRAGFSMPVIPEPTYTESFEGAFPPASWGLLNPDGGTGWNQQAVGTTPVPGWNGGILTGAPNGGNFMAFCTWNTGGPAFNDQWLTSPQLLNVTDGEYFRFSLRYWPDSYNDTLDILISTTDPSNPANFTVPVAQLGFGLGSDTNWVQYSYDLTNYVSAGSNVYIGFREHVDDNLNNGSSFSYDMFQTNADVLIAAEAPVILAAQIGGDSQYRSFWVNGSWDSLGVFDPNWGGPMVELKDDGVAPDAVAGDAIFTGSTALAIDAVNTYNWWTGSENDDASFLETGAGFMVTSANPVYPDTLVVDGNGGINQWVISLPGSFNGWDPAALDMTRQGTKWSAVVHLTPGTYEYKFAVMHQWDAAYGNGGIGGGIPNYSINVVSYGDFLFTFDDADNSQMVEPYIPPIFMDDFEAYTAGVQLAAQNPTAWTTWSNAPGTAEDPFVSTAQAHSGVNSVNIIPNNDCVKPLPNYTSGIYKISFYLYVPTGNGAYFNTLQVFSPPATFTWGMQVFFDQNGQGSIDGNGAGAATFTYAYDTWLHPEVIVNLNTDWAEFYLDGVLVHGWQWSLGTFGTPGPVQLAANNFFGGGTTAPTIYFLDDYSITQLDVPTGIVDPVAAIPTQFALDQNYPNPFNPTTTIKYALKENAQVTLKIYNMLGQEVRTLVNANQEAGYKQVVWDGMNNYGSPVASGIYIYQIQAGSFVKAHKMILMK